MSQPTLDCPFCGGTLSLKPSRYGRFCGCSGYPACDATVGAHPDGSPLGTPANRPLKDARIAAHASFDRLWKDGGSRGRAYRFLQSALNLSEDTCHIGMFDLATCARVVEVCDREMGRRSGIHGKPAQRKRVRQ